jgi:hypothetical protein
MQSGGGRYRHYKGGLYELLCSATLESDLSEMVVYRAADGRVWVRPASVFFETIEVDGVMVARFAPIDAIDAIDAIAPAESDQL